MLWQFQRMLWQLVVRLLQPSSSWMRTKVWRNIRGLIQMLLSSIALELWFLVWPSHDTNVVPPPPTPAHLQECDAHYFSKSSAWILQSFFLCLQGRESTSLRCLEQRGWEHGGCQAVCCTPIRIGYCEQEPAKAAIVVGKGEYLCLAPALGCALPHSGRAAPGAPSSIITWLYPGWAQAALIFFSCVLSLDSCLVSCHG